MKGDKNLLDIQEKYNVSWNFYFVSVIDLIFFIPGSFDIVISLSMGFDRGRRAAGLRPSGLRQGREMYSRKHWRGLDSLTHYCLLQQLALRAGNEKEEGETADTVGCCSLRIEHLTLHEEKDGKQFVVDFDFLGKDSIRYTNSVPVEKRVFKNLQLFMENKQPEDDVFDRLNVSFIPNGSCFSSVCSVCSCFSLCLGFLSCSNWSKFRRLKGMLKTLWLPDYYFYLFYTF